MTRGRRGEYLAGVDSSDLTPEQVERLRATVGRQLRFLNKLCARMQKLRWPVEDQVCRDGLRARDAVQDLYTALHYAGRTSGVGKPGR